MVDGEVLMNRPASGPATPVAIASDAIALSADGSMLYYGPLSGRTLHAVPTAMLRDPSVSEETLARAVRSMGRKGASDGIAEDDRGRVFAGDYEHNAIRVLDRGHWSTLVSDPRISWPIPCRSAPMAISTLPRTSFTASPAFMAAATCVASRMNCSASRSVAPGAADAALTPPLPERSPGPVAEKPVWLVGLRS